jgi:hypothetical protein
MVEFHSQEIEKHQWENRVLLIFTSDKNGDDYKNQLQKLLENKEDLEERKIIIYKFTENEFSTNFNKTWSLSNSLLKKFVNNKDNFKVFLIGLDGGIKLEQNTILSPEKLFTIIDGMPMRKRELKNKN